MSIWSLEEYHPADIPYESVAALRAIDRLKKSVDMTPQRKSVELPDGSEFEYWVSPMTLKERKAAQKQAKTDDPNDYALVLLVSKAKDENGTQLFAPGDLADLRNEMPATVVEQLMLQLLVSEEVEEEDTDLKSIDEGLAA